jgi:arsenite/tail-anchored protein-transporting ATPase
VVNRVLAPNSGYLEGWRALQERYLDEVRLSFGPIPIQVAPQYPSEVIGSEGLSLLAADLYGRTDPAEIMFRDCVFEIKKQQGEYRLRIRLPMLQRERLRIRSTGDELVLQLENQRRIISLPAALSGYRPIRANYEENYLTVCFGRVEEENHKDTEDTKNF